MSEFSPGHSPSRYENHLLMQIVIFLPQGVHSLEICGPLDVFAEANLRSKRVRYDVRVVVEGDGPIVCESPLRIVPDATIREISGN